MTAARFRIILAALSFLAAVALISAGYAGWQLMDRPGQSRADSAERDPLAVDPGLEALSIPDFSLRDQYGETRTEEIFLGEVTILDFFFTNCPFVCPPMQRNMKQLQERLAGTGVHFVSIAVDPERDTPERLRQFADEFGADLSTWAFLTGERAEIQRILTDGLLLAPLQEDASNPIALESGETMSNIVHPSHFILIGPDGDVLALHNGLAPAEVETIGRRAKAAAAALEMR